jgi:guanylate kinase
MSAAAKLFVITAPSGAGKTSLVRALMAHDRSLAHSVSYTTRKPRPGEQDGKDYHFVDRAEFERMLAAGAFLEHAEVFDNRYGTARAQVEAFLAQGRNAILEIDWQGARQVRAAMPACVSVFVLPPTRAALEHRLEGRGTDSPEVIARRLRDAKADMAHWAEADFVVVNDDFERALADLQAVVAGRGAGLGRERAELKPLVAALLA